MRTNISNDSCDGHNTSKLQFKIVKHNHDSDDELV